MTTYQKSVAAWWGGGVLGAVLGGVYRPAGKSRIVGSLLGGALGAMVVGGVLADPLLERAQARKYGLVGSGR